MDRQHASRLLASGHTGEQRAKRWLARLPFVVSVGLAACLHVASAAGQQPSRISPMPPLGASRANATMKEYAELERQILELLHEHRKTQDFDEQILLRQRISELTTKQFDLRQQTREQEVERLKQRLEEVEGSVRRRQELKDRIVEKRVSELLDSDHELRWDGTSWGPLGTPVGSPISVFGPAMLPATAPGVLPALPAGNPFSPSSDVRPFPVAVPVVEEVTDETGATKKITRLANRSLFMPNRAPSADSAGSPSVLDALSMDRASILATGSGQLTVAEAEARLRLIEGKINSARQRLSRGSEMSADERLRLAGVVQELNGELELAKIQLQQAEQFDEARQTLLRLDVQAAESDLVAAEATYTQTQRLNKASPTSVSQAEMTKQRAEWERAKIALERARTILELHQQYGSRPSQQMPKDDTD